MLLYVRAALQEGQTRFLRHKNRVGAIQVGALL